MYKSIFGRPYDQATLSLCIQQYQYSSTKVGTDIAQYGGEVVDLVKGGTKVWEDSKSDMEANKLGQAYGWELYNKYHPVRATIRSLD